MAGSGAAIAILIGVLTLNRGTALPRRTGDIEKFLKHDRDVVTHDEVAPEQQKQNWSRFRGWDGSGNALVTNAPTLWDPKTGNGIAWKAPVAAKGYNSPIVWAGKVYFSGASDRQRTIFCLEATTGQMAWHESVPTATAAPDLLPESAGQSSYATATMAADGQRVYAFFGNGDLAAFTADGKLAWLKRLGPLQNAYGHAASLAMWREKLILQVDQGEAEAGKSKIYAFDGRTGNILWQQPRRVGSSWATPIIIQAAGTTQIITLAVPWVIAYNVNDGAELWRVDGLNGEITPSPVFAAGFVFVASPSEKLMAIRAEGFGDVTKTHIAWTTEENVPDITSSVCDGKLIFTLTTPGVLTCFDALNGKKQWEHDFGIEFHASPAIAAGRVYLFSRKGTAIMVAASPEFEELFRTEMPDAFESSPAFVEHQIFLRGETNIWCLGGQTVKIAKH